MSFRFNPFTGNLDYFRSSGGGPGGPNDGLIISDTIDPSSSKVIDTYALASLNAVEYFVSIRNSDNSKNKLLRISAQKTDADLITQVYNRTGLGLSSEIDVELNGPNAELLINNLEGETVFVSVTRTVI